MHQIYIHTYEHKSAYIQAYKFVHTSMQMCICMCIQMHTCVHTNAYTWCAYKRIHTMCIQTHAHKEHTSAYIHAYKCTHACIQAHTYVLSELELDDGVEAANDDVWGHLPEFAGKQLPEHNRGPLISVLGGDPAPPDGLRARVVAKPVVYQRDDDHHTRNAPANGV